MLSVQRVYVALPHYAELRDGSPVMQTLMLAGIIFGLAASVAWAAFLGFELFRVIGLMF
jgi:hypothetical protein